MESAQRVIFGLLVVVVAATGCRYRPCGPFCAAQNNGGLLANWDGIGNARVAPPGTGAYQIPTAGNQPYYTPTTTASLPNTTTGGNASLPAGPVMSPSGPIGSGFNPPSNFSNPPASLGTPPTYPQQGYTNPQPGWRPTDAPNGTGFYGPTTQPMPGGLNSTSYQQTAPDYRSTSIDERFDPTRMPATDASMVRAPTNWNLPASWPASNQVATNSNWNTGRFEYRTTPQISASGGFTNTGFPSMGSGVSAPSYPYTNSQPQVVLAQASTSPELLARDPNYQNGWRDRYTAGTNLTR